MSLSGPNATYISGGNIEPCVFLAPGTGDNTAVQANATSKVIGVSPNTTRAFPDSTNSGTQYAAVAGDPIASFEIGDFCWLKIGTGGCSAGSFLKPDANGYGVAATTTGDKYYAVSREAHAAGEIAWVQLIGTAVV